MTAARQPLVGIIMGSDSDLPVMQKAADMLDELAVPYELTIVSAHRTPQRLYDYAGGAEERGLRVIIAGAGGAAHLPGMAAALTLVRRALAAEAEVTRLRAENDVLRKSTDAAVDGVRAMLPEALKVAREEGEAAAREWAANVCERMVVGGCAWSEEQAIAGRALLAAAESIRTLPIDACAEAKS